MAMSVIPVRLSEGIIRQIDSLVEMGLYPNRSEVIRDGVRF